MNLNKLLSRFFGILSLLCLTGCGVLWGGITWDTNTPVLNYSTCANATVLAIGTPASIAATQSQVSPPFSVSPALPTGLSISSTTGTISGTPSTVTGPTTYTISSPQSSTTISIQTMNGYVVNSSGDGTDFTPGNHICETATGNGICTLRAALVEANADGVGTWNIIVPPVGTIVIGSTLPLSNTLNIYGQCPGLAVVDGANLYTVFTVSSALTVSMQSLKVQNGFEAGNVGAALENFLFVATFNGSFMDFYNSSGPEGAIDWATTASFNCNDCIFDSNQVTAGGPGNYGGALSFNDTGTNTLNRCLFVNNSAVVGGGIGGIFDGSGGTTYTNCTFYNNSNQAIYVNKTFNPTDTINNCTFVNNNALSDAFGGGAINLNNGTVVVNMANNIFYNNPGGGDPTCWNAGGTLNDNGGNLVYPASTHCVFGAGTDISIAPTLGPFQNNGGFSDTLALLLGSAGIDQALVGLCPPVDQRDYPRINHCDIGAFQTQP